tara:strand:+ start:2383 stop:3861 length:1479 start_codon:yes stop_codon:yes gene_type:complete
MQTPGSTIQPQTPMVPLERRMSNAYDALIRRSEENQQIERGPQARQFGRIMLQFEQLNNNMEVIRAEIRRDMRARQKFFIAEQKLMKKDSENLDSIRAGAFFELRRDIGIIAAAAGARDLSDGNVGDATSNFGVAITAFIPEIAMGVAALLGLGVGAKGGGTSPIAAGGGKMRGLGGKGGLLTIAALAAMILMGGKSQADERRKSSTLLSTEGPAVNVSDSERFRSQLDRFDSILDSFGISSPEEEKGIPTIKEKEPDIELKPNKNYTQSAKDAIGVVEPKPFEPDEKKDKDKEVEKEIIQDDKLSGQLGSLSKDLAFVSETNDDRWMNFMNASRGIPVATTDLQGLNIGKVFDTSSTADTRRLAEIAIQTGEEEKQPILSTKIETENDIDKLESVFESNFGISDDKDKKSWLDWRPSNPFKNIKIGGGNKQKEPIIIDNDNGTTTQRTAPIPEGTGPTGSPEVHTSFMKGGGAIDKFDYALSLKTYASLGS